MPEMETNLARTYFLQRLVGLSLVWALFVAFDEVLGQGFSGVVWWVLAALGAAVIIPVGLFNLLTPRFPHRFRLAPEGITLEYGRPLSGGTVTLRWESAVRVRMLRGSLADGWLMEVRLPRDFGSSGPLFAGGTDAPPDWMRTARILVHLKDWVLLGPFLPGETPVDSPPAVVPLPLPPPPPPLP